MNSDRNLRKRQEMNKWFMLIAATFFFTFTSAQDYMPKGGRYGGKKTKYRRASSALKRNKTDVFPLDPDFRLNGWYAALGGTYMLPMKDVSENGYSRSVVNDTTFETFSQYDASASGKLGLYIEAGWFHSFQDPPFFHFFEIGLSYKQYKGGETSSGSYRVTATDSLGQSFEGSPSNFSGEGQYSDHLLSLNSRISHHHHFSRYGFLQNSLGVNVDYFLIKSRSSNSNIPGKTETFPEDFQAQLNYRLGVGWKASPTILIIPSVEVPFLTAYPFDDFKSSLPYFSTRHFPIVFSIRIMFLRRISEDCKVPNYDGPSNFN